MRLLLVDDDPTTVHILSLLCASRGHVIDEAPDAETAWARFEEGLHALVLLDWLLPGTDGVTLCRRMRAHKGGERAVILMVTAQDRPEHLQEMLDAGADDYLPKPIDPGHFNVRMTIAEKRALQREALHRASTELARRRADALKLGAEIQRTFLLGHPPAAFPGLEIAASAEAAQEVSGDFVDFWPDARASRMDVVVGDVVGKGVPAALLGAAVKSQLVRTIGDLALHTPAGRAPEPVEIVRRMQTAMNDDLLAVSQFFTLVHVRLDLAAGTLTYVNCGHPSILFLRAGATEGQYLPGHSAPVGLGIADEPEAHTVPLGRGDLVVQYSDGVIEARRGGGWYGDEFGPQRLARLVEEHARRPAQEILNTVQAEVVAHAAPAAPGDDVTVVVLRVS